MIQHKELTIEELREELRAVVLQPDLDLRTIMLWNLFTSVLDKIEVIERKANSALAHSKATGHR